MEMAEVMESNSGDVHGGHHSSPGICQHVRVKWLPEGVSKHISRTGMGQLKFQAAHQLCSFVSPCLGISSQLWPKAVK
jgi:hypothetical protein